MSCELCARLPESIGVMARRAGYRSWWGLVPATISSWVLYIQLRIHKILLLVHITKTFVSCIRVCE
jgi:hypothetical protein